MSERAAIIGTAMQLVRRAIDSSPGRPGLLNVVFDILAAERDHDPSAAAHTCITPERAAAILGISSNRMRRLCAQPGVALRVNGRWLVRSEWLADEIIRRRALGLMPAL